MMVGLAFHLLLTAAYALAAVQRLPRLQAAAETLLVLLLPFFSFAILVVWHITCHLLHTGALPLYEEGWQRAMISLEPLAYQADVVPLQDTYLLGDARLRRRLFTDAIKQEVVNNEAVLRQAVHDEDREIAYYAVSLMTARAEKLAAELYVLEQQLRAAGADDEPLLRRYAATLEAFLASGSGDEVSRREKRGALLSALAALAKAHPESTLYFEQALRQLLASGAYEQAEAVLRDYARQHPGEEGPYLCELRLALAWRWSCRRSRRCPAVSPLTRSQRFVTGIGGRSMNKRGVYLIFLAVLLLGCFFQYLRMDGFLHLGALRNFAAVERAKQQPWAEADAITRDRYLIFYDPEDVASMFARHNVERLLAQQKKDYESHPLREAVEIPQETRGVVFVTGRAGVAASLGGAFLRGGGRHGALHAAAGGGGRYGAARG